eukprot:g3021.t1
MWKCPVCMFGNAASSMECEMCCSDRPPGAWGAPAGGSGGDGGAAGEAKVGADDARAIAEAKEPEFDCPICMESYKVSDGVTLDCDHRFCPECVAHHFRAKIEVRKVKDSDLCCPMCPHQASPFLIKAAVDTKTWNKYNRFKMMDEVKGLVVCPRDCGWMCIVEGGIEAVQCRTCANFSFCAKCEMPAHKGLTCDEAKRKAGEDAADEEIKKMRIREGWKACPACGEWNCGKKDPNSCDHVKCPSCTHEFCFVCLADRKVIYEHGNHYHRPNCKFYSYYDGSDDKCRPKCPECKRLGRLCSVPPCKSCGKTGKDCKCAKLEPPKCT